MIKIAIIGGGAAGLMAAIRMGGEPKLAITLFEKNPFCGKKIGITGKGRCNVTNAASVREMEEKIPRGGKFLRTALYAFPPSDTVDFFEQNGVPLKTERGGRIFPVSDRAKDIVNLLVKKALENQNVVLKKEEVLSVSKNDLSFLVETESGKGKFDRVIIATGGKSYPLTGSTGAGYRFARELGHKIEPPKPALCPLLAKEAFCKEAMGLSLKNCALEIFSPSGKKIYEDFGEMLFCHFGVSGPMMLSASSYLDFEKEPFYRAFLDLKPALSFEMLDKRVLSDFAKNQNRDLINSLSDLLPQKLILPVIQIAGIEMRKKVNLVSKEERNRLVNTLKKFPLTLVGTRPIEEAIITRGGVSLSEIDPRTMQSRLHKGLYFAGEVIDADALTGGFNLQIAFSTGHLAGRSISQEEV